MNWLNEGVNVAKDGEMSKTVVRKDFAQGKHDMICAILELTKFGNLLIWCG